jgi:hypothetical protein
MKYIMRMVMFMYLVPMFMNMLMDKVNAYQKFLVVQDLR